ncbi:MAG: radical SAM protein [Candidatus Hermodarchaeota archaeon]
MVEMRKIVDKSLMMVFLLEKCNFSCIHCVRVDEPMPIGYKLSFEQLKLCLSDCHTLETIEWVHFSGGEPTLWTDEKLDLADLLIEISKAGFEPGFTTNGSYFIDYIKCHELFQKYFNNANKRLRLYISIDTFHQNFNVQKGRAKSLDNVIKYKLTLPSKKRELFNIIVITTISKDPQSLLPKKMIKHYQSLGLEFLFLPLRAVGKGKSLSYLCPNLESNKQEELGAYYPFHQKKERKERFVTINLVLIDNGYYFHNPWRKIGSLGHIPLRVIDMYKLN